MQAIRGEAGLGRYFRLDVVGDMKVRLVAQNGRTEFQEIINFYCVLCCTD